MQIDFTDRVVVVTGASKGIGFACASAFARANARVVIVSRSHANLERAVAEMAPAGHHIHAIAADLTHGAEAERAIEEVESAVGAIDALVNCAGAARRYTLDQLNMSAWEDAMRAKFFTYVSAIDAVVRRMRPRRRGAIVNIIGMGGKVASPTHLPGGAANAALMLATCGLASAYAPDGIRVNGINPGPTLTGRVEQAVVAEAAATRRSKEEALAEMMAKIPLGRLATAEEVANVALFLASDLASYVTGAIVPMDGGAVPVA